MTPIGSATERVHSITCDLFDGMVTSDYKIITRPKPLTAGYTVCVRLIGPDGELVAGIAVSEANLYTDDALRSLIHDRMTYRGLKPHGWGEKH